MEIEMKRARDIDGSWLVVGDTVVFNTNGRTAQVTRIYREQGERDARVEISNAMYDLFYANSVRKVA